MKKMNVLLAVLSLGAATCAFAYPGYLGDDGGHIVRGIYGDCIHTDYFSKDTDGLAQCGEGTEPISYETVTLSDKGHVLFNFNKADLTGAGKSAIKNFITRVDHQHAVMNIAVAGHTDAIGAADYNLQLSQARANTIKQFLISNGYPESRIEAKGYGAEDAKVSSGCFTQYGQDNSQQINALQHKLNANKFKAPHLSHAVLKQKRALQAKLTQEQTKHANLIECTAPDRKVVFTIEYTSKQVAKHSETSSVDNTDTK